MRPTTMADRVALLCAVMALGAGLSGCRNTTSRLPPVHLNPNMDQQHYFEAQEENPFFADGRAMRPQVAGTVARGALGDDDLLYRGKLPGGGGGQLPGQFCDALPISVTMDRALLVRGQSRFNIYCAPCHDQAGSGQGVIARRAAKLKAQGWVAPPDFQGIRVRTMPLGQIFDTITNGARAMPAYGHQIPLRDRWAVAAWVRVLQASRGASLAQVPGDIAEQKGWISAAPPAPAPTKAATP